MSSEAMANGHLSAPLRAPRPMSPEDRRIAAVMSMLRKRFWPGTPPKNEDK